ncbi:MAG: hypothetical protein RSA40_01265 [Malacoplasma sp.]
MESTLIETRIKRYKLYRVKIKKESNLLEKKRIENDEIKAIEKKLSKIDSSLLIKKNLFSPFEVDNISNQGEYEYINELLILITQLDDEKYSKLIHDSMLVEYNLENEPTFDEKGKITNVWLHDDLYYKELLEIKHWVSLMVNNFPNIENEIKRKLFVFKDVLYKTKSKEVVENLLRPNVNLLKVKRNKNSLLIFAFLQYCLFVIALLILVFMIIFFVGP